MDTTIEYILNQPHENYNDFIRWCVFRVMFMYSFERVENYIYYDDWARASCSTSIRYIANNKGIVVPSNDTLISLCDDYLRAAWDTCHTVSALCQED